jgi:hypothetical protein
MSVEHASTTRLPMRRRFCAYCGVRVQGYACAAHRDLRRLEGFTKPRPKDLRGRFVRD